MPTAVLIGGAFFIKRFRAIEPPKFTRRTSGGAFKKQVDQIVLIAGDADFVPAAKQARREGIDFILDPMWQPIPPNLNEHIDGLRSTCPQPQRRASRP